MANKTRKLDNVELSIAIKSVKKMKEELDYNQYQYDICELKLTTGLEIEYLKQIRDYKKLKKEFEADIGILKDKLKVTENMIRNGVEIKSNKEDK